MEWKFAEVLTTLRDYQLLLNQIAVVLITGACILSYKNRRLASRKVSFGLTAASLGIAIITLFLGLSFRSKLVDITLALDYVKNPSSLTDETLKCLLISQVALLSLGAVVLAVAAGLTPRDRNSNGS